MKFARACKILTRKSSSPEKSVTQKIASQVLSIFSFSILHPGANLQRTTQARTRLVAAELIRR
jgi:hypothetical protein